MPRDRAAIAERWLRWAHEDLKAAEHLANDDAVVPRAACVFAHQAAEKALKGLLVARHTDPPRLHDLDRLAAQLPEADNEPFDAVDLPELTRWAIEGRYPDDVEEATRDDAQRSVALAAQVVTIALRAMTSKP